MRARSFGRRFADVVVACAICGLLILIAARLDRVETRQASGAPTVNDGDTITISGERIRLRGIDAPELHQTCRKAGVTYRCGQDARSALVDLIAGREIACTGWERDRYRRLLASCMADATDINRSLVQEGWAVAYGDFEAEERLARDGKIGLWAGEFDRPRQWREMHGGMAESTHDALGAIMNWLREMFGFS